MDAASLVVKGGSYNNYTGITNLGTVAGVEEGSINIGSNGMLTANGGSVTVGAAGTPGTVNTEGTVTIGSKGALLLGGGDYAQEGGTSTVSGILNTGSLFIEEGTYTNSSTGITRIGTVTGTPVAGSINVGSNGELTDPAAIIKIGTVTGTSAEGSITIGSNGTLTDNGIVYVGETAPKDMPGAVNTEGTVTIGSGGTMTLFVNGSYTQTGGTTTVNGTLNAGSLDIGGGTFTNGTGITNVGTVSGTPVAGSLNIYSDGTLTGSGSIKVGAANTPGTVNNAGAVTIGSAGSLSVSGNGYYTQTSGTTLVEGKLSATSLGVEGGTYTNSTGTTTIGSGKGGSAAGSISIGSNGTLNDNAAIISGVPESKGSVSTAGKVTIGIAGTLTVLGFGGYKETGGTTTDNGAIIASSFSLSGVGTLNGTGAVEANVSNNAGIVQAGSSGSGTLTVGGTYKQGPGGSLLEDINGAGSYSVLDINGSAKLGGHLDIMLNGGVLPTNGETFTILDAKGGLSGKFSSIIGGTFTGGSWDVLYGADTVELEAVVGAATTRTFSNVSAKHFILATVQGSGSIVPSGTLSVSTGANQAFTITPTAGHSLTSVLVDGEPVSGLSGGKSLTSASLIPSAETYTFASVTADHSISAVFSVIPPPVADAGPDQIVGTGSVVTLDGSNSTDPVVGIASYKWIQISGPRVALSNPSSPTSTFAAPNVASGELLVFELVVTNNGGVKNSNSCFVNVSASDEAPLANAGPGQTVSPYTIVNLNGSGSSDPDGKITSYKWVQTEGPKVEILNADSAIASFVAPYPGPLGASLVFQLRVANHFGLTTRDQCTINVINADPPPVADAGPNLTAAEASSVTLDGSGSQDSGGSALTYRWKQIRGIPVTLSEPMAATPVFTAPSIADGQNADLLFMLTVTDVDSRLSTTAECAVAVASQ